MMKKCNTLYTHGRKKNLEIIWPLSQQSNRDQLPDNPSVNLECENGNIQTSHRGYHCQYEMIIMIGFVNFDYIMNASKIIWSSCESILNLSSVFLFV